MVLTGICGFLALVTAAGVYCAGVYFYKYMEHRNELELLRSDYEHAKASMASMVSEIDHLVDQIAENRIKHAEELRRREHHEDQRVDNLLSQVQNLSERLAALKLAGGEAVVVDGQPQWAPEEPRTKPYSEGLYGFMSGLHTEEARTLVEDYIEAQRSVGRDDEQILDQLNRGEYVNV